MATEIKVINLARMHQAEDYTFHSLALAEMQACEEASFASLKEAYAAAFEAFDAELKTAGGADPLTKEVTEADAATDRCYTGMVAIARAMLYHHDAATVELARRVLLIVDRYGNPTNAAYLEEYGVIDNLLQDLRAFDTEVVGSTEEGSGEEEEEERPGGLSLLAADTHNLTTLGLDSWVTQLQQCRDRFMQLFTQRNAQLAKAETGKTKAARKAADEAYRAAVKRLNALIEVNGIGTYETLVANLNQLIDRQKGIQAARNTRNASKNNGSSEEEGGSAGEERPGGL